METRFIMTAFSKDRPGVVADLTGIIYENGCNLEDSEMTSILDEFAIILLFSGSGERLKEKLLNDCRRLEREKGITAFIRPVEDTAVRDEKPSYRKTISLEGIDQAGIVCKVSRYLADSAVNIENLTTRRTISPESGTAIYFMEIKVQVPENLSLEQLEKGLSGVGEELNLDITVG